MYSIYNIKFVQYIYSSSLAARRVGRSVQLPATAFGFKLFRHLSYMDISSRREYPFLVAAHTCETSATNCVSMRIESILLFRACDANSRIVNITPGSSKDPLWSPKKEIARAKGSESGKL